MAAGAHRLRAPRGLSSRAAHVRCVLADARWRAEGDRIRRAAVAGVGRRALRRKLRRLRICGRLGRCCSAGRSWRARSGVAKSKAFPEALWGVIRRLEADAEPPMADTVSARNPYSSAAELLADLQRMRTANALQRRRLERLLKHVTGQRPGLTRRPAPSGVVPLLEFRLQAVKRRHRLKRNSSKRQISLRHVRAGPQPSR